MDTTAQIVVRPAIVDDAAAIQEVFYQGWLAAYPNAEHGITVGDIEDRFKDRLSEETLCERRKQIANPAEGTTTLVAKKGDMTIGVCRVGKHADGNHLYALYVLPEYHRQGVGTALWNIAQRYLDPTKHTLVEVATYNVNAVKFYEKLGFVDTGRRMRDPRFTMKSGAIIPEMEMHRTATP